MITKSRFQKILLPPATERLGVTCNTVGVELTVRGVSPDSKKPEKTLVESSLFNGLPQTATEWILSYVVNGSGTMAFESGTQYEIRQGMVTLIPPSSRYRYSIERSKAHCLYYVTFEGQSLTERKVCTAIDELYPVAEIGLNTEVIEMFRRLLEIGNSKTPDAQREMGATVVLLVAKLVNRRHEFQASKRIQNSTDRAKAIMIAHLSDHISIGDVADELGIPVSTFRRVFRSEVGVSPYQFFLQCKVEAAKQELTRYDIPLRAIADKYGFSDQYHFSRVFTHVTGFRPTEWRHRGIDLPIE